MAGTKTSKIVKLESPDGRVKSSGKRSPSSPKEQHKKALRRSARKKKDHISMDTTVPTSADTEAIRSEPIEHTPRMQINDVIEISSSDGELEIPDVESDARKKQADLGSSLDINGSDADFATPSGKILTPLTKLQLFSMTSPFQSTSSSVIQPLQLNMHPSVLDSPLALKSDISFPSRLAHPSSSDVFTSDGRINLSTELQDIVQSAISTSPVVKSSAKDVAKASGHAGSSSTSKSYETLELLAENTIIEYLNMNDDVLQKLINDKIVDEEKLARCILYSMSAQKINHIFDEDELDPALWNERHELKTLMFPVYQKFLRQWDGMNIQYSGIWVTEHLVITRNDLASDQFRRLCLWNPRGSYVNYASVDPDRLEVRQVLGTQCVCVYPDGVSRRSKPKAPPEPAFFIAAGLVGYSCLLDVDIKYRAKYITLHLPHILAEQFQGVIYAACQRVRGLRAQLSAKAGFRISTRSENFSNSSFTSTATSEPRLNETPSKHRKRKIIDNSSTTPGPNGYSIVLPPGAVVPVYDARNKPMNFDTLPPYKDLERLEREELLANDLVATCFTISKYYSREKEADFISLNLQWIVLLDRPNNS